jgi:hypothetical protein
MSKVLIVDKNAIKKFVINLFKFYYNPSEDVMKYNQLKSSPLPPF